MSSDRRDIVTLLGLAVGLAVVATLAAELA